MAQTITYKKKCEQCGGTGTYSGNLIGGGDVTCPWPGCNGTGYYEVGQFVLDPSLEDMQDTINDILDKCNDIKEKVDEL